jgi:COMPASS component SWD1
VNATFACFSKEGDQTLVGTSKGAVHILDTATKAELKCVQLGGSSIKSLYLAKDGKSFLANSADHVIRARSLEKILAGEPDKPRELRDVVNRVQWAHASFTSDSEHVVGTANSATDHLLYIWDMHGHLTTILGQGEKVKDGALHFACHPTRPILAVCSRSGSVYIWTKKYSENWSAFAPDFKELEENEEYDEREDEFDIKPVRLRTAHSLALSFSL